MVKTDAKQLAVILPLKASLWSVPTREFDTWTNGSQTRYMHNAGQYGTDWYGLVRHDICTLLLYSTDWSGKVRNKTIFDRWDCRIHTAHRYMFSLQCSWWMLMASETVLHSAQCTVQWVQGGTGRSGKFRYKTILYKVFSAQCAYIHYSVSSSTVSWTPVNVCTVHSVQYSTLQGGTGHWSG